MVVFTAVRDASSTESSSSLNVMLNQVANTPENTQTCRFSCVHCKELEWDFHWHLFLEEWRRSDLVIDFRLLCLMENDLEFRRETESISISEGYRQHVILGVIQRNGRKCMSKRWGGKRTKSALYQSCVILI